ncbi:DNA excision repair protein ERCC-5-like [Amphiura filiformis]|uniref:DNA excision repair protein ERCC-5-like n=1 Tax=Amphiura filiformis TaxID=82378 RepID=UPI003B22210A
MGVHGLWQLLESTGRPVTLESLEGKILAVDVSLWLHQAVRGMRDDQGNAATNAHLQVLFNRICKLLFYRIKPVFVFDGGVPQLKKQTMVARRQRRDMASSNLKSAVNKVLNNYMKTHALKAVVGCACELPEPPTRVPLQRGGSSKSQEPDLFELPPMPENSEEGQKDEEEPEDMWVESQQHMSEFAREEDVDVMDIDSDVFKALPLEVQHELITVKKEKGKRTSWKKIKELPKQAGDFSNYQLSKLLNKGKMTQRLDELRKEMKVRNTGAVANLLDYENNIDELHAGRIMSEDREHYVLVKNKPSDKNADKASSSGASQEASSSEKLEEELLTDTNKSTAEVKDSSTSWDVDLTEMEDSSPTAEKSKEISDAVKSFFAKNNLQVHSGANSKEQDQTDSEIHSQKLTAESKGAIRTISESESKEDDVEIISDGEVDASPPMDNVEIVDVKRGTKTRNMQSLVTTAIDLIYSEVTDSGKEGNTDMTSSGKIVSDDVIASKSQEKEQLVEEKAESDDVMSDDVMIVGEVEGTKSLKQPAKMSKPPTNMQKMAGPFPFMSSLMDKLIASALSDNLEVSEDVLSKRAMLSKENGQDGKPEIVGSGDDSGMLDNSDDSDDDFVEVPVYPVNDSPKEEAKPQTPASPVLEREVVLEPESHEHKDEKDVTADVIDLEEGDMNYEEDADEHNEVEIEEEAASEKDDNIDDIQDDDGDIAMETREEENQEGQRESAVQEWAGMNVENPSQLQDDLESERHALATERQRQERVAVSVTDVMYAESKELLQLFGIPFIVSPQEAEAQCAYLDVTGQSNGTITDDSDVWLFGGRYVYKNFFTKGKDVEFYRSNHLEKQLVLTREKLIQLAYLLGSDYTDGVQGVGAITAMELLSEFPGQGLDALEKFKDWLEKAQKQLMPPVESVIKSKLRKLTINPGFPNPHVREAYLKPVVDESKEKFTWGSPDLDLLREFASAKLGWNRSKIDEMLLPVLRKLNEKQVQSKINHYFPTEDNEPRPIKSKRLQRVLKKFHNPDAADDEVNCKRKKYESESDDDDKPMSHSRKGEQDEVRRSGRVSRKVIPSLGEKKKKKRKKEGNDADVHSAIPSENTSADHVQVIDSSNGAMEVKGKSESSTRGNTGKGERRGKGRVGVKGKGKLLAKKGGGNKGTSRSGPKLSESSSNDSD